MICSINNKPVAQGDMLIRKIEQLPKNVTLTLAEDGNYVLTHSESGHHHIVRKQENIEFYANDNDPMIAYLVVNNPKEICLVEHMRSFDTHAPYQLKDGVYEIRRQIESTPEGFRRALD
jgi:hypothetical protein